MEHAHDSFIPAAGHDWALPLYDRLAGWLGFDRVARELLERCQLEPGQRVLDVGCGTGTLAVLVKRLHPEAEVVGLDADPKALARARRKAALGAIGVRFDHGRADSLPYDDATFDRVFSTFMFHHLDERTKLALLREVRRVLAPGGAFHLVDFAPSTASDGGFARHLPWNHRALGQSAERMTALLREAGFSETTRLEDHAVRFGRAAHFVAHAPNADAPEMIAAPRDV